MTNSESTHRTEVHQRRGALDLREKSYQEKDVRGEQHDESQAPLQALDRSGSALRDFDVLSVDRLEDDHEDAQNLAVRKEPTVKPRTTETQTRATPSE